MWNMFENICSGSGAGSGPRIKLHDTGSEMYFHFVFSIHMIIIILRIHDSDSWDNHTF